MTESKLNLRTDDLWMYRLETDIITPEDALRAVYDASLNDPHLDQAQRSAVLHAVYDVERKLRDEQRRTLRRAALDQFGMAAMLCRERKRYGRPPGHKDGRGARVRRHVLPRRGIETAGDGPGRSEAVSVAKKLAAVRSAIAMVEALQPNQRRR